MYLIARHKGQLLNPVTIHLEKSFGAIEKVLCHLYFISGSFEQGLFDFYDITMSGLPIRIITARYTNPPAEPYILSLQR
jgi:hypothetical protein